jgi:hypothetical protein
VGIPKIENFKMRAIESACLKCRDMNANPPHPPQPPSTPIAAPPDEELCLMGVNGLAEFMDFVRTRAVDGAKFDRGDLAEMWRAAAEVFAALQTSEAGAADHPKGVATFGVGAGPREVAGRLAVFSADVLSGAGGVWHG